MGILAFPIHSDIIRLFLIIIMELTLESIVEGMPKVMRQVNVGSSNHKPFGQLLYAHDPMQGMVPGLSCPQMPDQVENFLPVFLRKITADGDDPGGIAIFDPVTGLAKLRWASAGQDSAHCHRPL